MVNCVCGSVNRVVQNSVTTREEIFEDVAEGRNSEQAEDVANKI